VSAVKAIVVRCIERRSRWLEQLDRISIRIFELNLPPAGSNLHLISEGRAVSPKVGDMSRQVRHAEYDAIPPAGLLLPPIGQRPRPGRTRPTENELEGAERDLTERGQMLKVEIETEVTRVELDRARDVAHLVADAVQPFDVNRSATGRRVVVVLQ